MDHTRTKLFRRRGSLAVLALACAATALYPTIHAAHAATAPMSLLYRTSTGPVADEAEPWLNRRSDPDRGPCPSDQLHRRFARARRRHR